MKVIVEIEGRNAIPVRAIPFLTNWATMSPDVVADALAGTAHHFRGLTSFRIEGPVHKKISTTWWENFPCRQLKALSDEIKAKQTTHETGYQEWRSRSIPILPAGVFVWQDEYETRHNYFHGPDGTSYLIQGNWLSENEQLTRVALDFDPFIPETHTQLIVMEGFHQPDAKTSPAFEPLTELIEQYANGKFEATPVGLRERVAQAFFPMPHWDQLAPDQRRSLAQQNDVQHDPALEPENEYWWQLTCRTQEIESEIKRWELMSDHGIPSEAVTKRNELNQLRSRLQQLNTLWSCPPFTVKALDTNMDGTFSECPPIPVDLTVSDATTPPRDLNPQGNERRVIATAELFEPEVHAKSRTFDAPARPGKNDLLAPTISVAQKQCNDPYETPAVWALLREMAVQRTSPFVGVTEDGLQWIDSNDDTKYLSLKHLRDRLGRQKKKANELA